MNFKLTCYLFVKIYFQNGAPHRKCSCYKSWQRNVHFLQTFWVLIQAFIDQVSICFECWTLTKSLKGKSTCESNLVFTCEFSCEFHMSFLTCKLGEIQLWIWKSHVNFFTFEFMFEKFHICDFTFEILILIKMIDILKGPYYKGHICVL